MRKLKHPLLTILTIATLLAIPLQPILFGHMPWQGDGLLHFYRLAALENAIAAGDWYPRWLPDLGYGYGFPLFNYYPPLSYYIALPFRWLGLPLKSATNASYMLAMVTLAISAYTLGRDLWSRTAGFVTTAALLTSPYILYNLHHRAALAELWGLATLTATLAAIQAARNTPTPGRNLLITFTYATLMLSHNITALIGTPIILGFIIWPCLTQKLQVTSYKLQVKATPNPKSKKLHLSSFIILGLLLTSFFWLPALLETSYVQIDQLTSSSNFTYANNFLTPTDLLALPQTADPLRVNPQFPLTLGWGQILVVMGYAILNIRIRTGQVTDQHPFHHASFFSLIITLISITMTLSLSQPLWETLPLLEFVQFPWRFLGPAALGLSLLCGYVVGELANSPLVKSTYQSAILQISLLTSCTLLILLALLFLFPTPPPQLTHSANRADLINFELDTGWIGTTSAADYLPSTVQQLPQPTFEPPQFTAEGAATTFNQFAYPGWQAMADGRPIPITPTAPYGLIQVTPPNDTETIEITFGNTLLRTAANWVSFITLIAIVIGVASYKRQIIRTHTPHPTISTQHPFIPHPISLILLFLAIFGLKTLYLDHNNTIFRRVNPPANKLNINFDNQLRLLDAQLPEHPVSADSSLNVELAWQLADNPQQELSVGLHLLSDSSARYAQSDNLHPADFPITRWQPAQYAIDSHQLQLDPTTPPGTYTLELFVYTVQDGRRLNTLSNTNTPIANTYPLGHITIMPPSSPVFMNGLTADGLYDTPLTLSNDLDLLGFQLPTNTAELGQTIPLTLYWRALQPPANPPQLILLSDTQREIPHQFPISSTAPNSEWNVRQIGRDQQFLTLPVIATDGTPLESGNYFLAILYNGQYQPLSNLRLTAPPRTFTPPTPQITLNQPLGNLTSLIGYDLSSSLIPNLSSLTATLYWQPLTITSTTYTAFLQLIDPSGRPIAQSDQIPINNDGLIRPTTGWVPNEFITDTHTLQLPDDLPTGTYTLITGLYNPVTNQRLRTETADHIIITQLTINDE